MQSISVPEFEGVEQPVSRSVFSSSLRALACVAAYATSAATGFGTEPLDPQPTAEVEIDVDDIELPLPKVRPRPLPDYAPSADPIDLKFDYRPPPYRALPLDWPEPAVPEPDFAALPIEQDKQSVAGESHYSPLYDEQTEWGDPTPVERLLLKGDTSVGTVVNLRQVHYTSAALENGSAFRIGEYQLELLRKLMDGNFRHVFAEGCERDIPPGSPEVLTEIGVALKAHFGVDELSDQQVRDILKALLCSDGELRTSFSNVERALAAVFGAPQLYAAICPEVTIHHTVTPEQRKKLEPAVEAFLKQLEQNSLDWSDPLIFGQRETYAIAAVMEFLSQEEGRGETVALVYGAAHEFGLEDFAAELESDELPQLREFYIPGLAKEYDQGSCAPPLGGLITALNIQQTKYADRQTDLVERAPKILQSIFGDLITEAAQLEALKKLDFGPDGTSDWDSLLKAARTDQVRALILKQQGAGMDTHGQ